MTKLLIIGSKGFIGSHALRYFNEQAEYEVFGCDVSVDYNDDNYFLVDSTNANYNKIFQTQKFDVCVNCSGAASVPDSLKNPIRDFTLNTVNVFKLLSAINDNNKACKFINLSSAAVYGNPTSLPIMESQELKPVSPYGKHKLMAEMICKEFSNDFGLNTISLRIFSAFGEGLKKQLFWDLYKKATGVESISLFGTGRESRDFIHVLDLLQIIELVMASSEFDGRAINAANGDEIFIDQAVSNYYSNFSEEVNYSFSGTNRKGDPINWVADISEIKKLGYNQKVSFTEGLSKYFTWAKGQE